MNFDGKRSIVWFPFSVMVDVIFQIRPLFLLNNTIGDIQTQENIIFLLSHDPDIGSGESQFDRTELDMDWKAHG